MHADIKALVANLKLLNAKERDHLMRLAYLGVHAPYEEPQERWLSNEMEAHLRLQFGARLDGKSCVFAAMDYHLDWLHAALYYACRSRNIGKPGTDLSAQPLGEAKNTTLRAINGSQEDVDLLAVFSNGEAATLLFIEAKGFAAFGRKQLARKLIRLDRILEESGARGSGVITAVLVLMGPPRPRATVNDASSLREYVQGASADPQFIEQLNMLADDLGSSLHFVELKGFPIAAMKVTRSEPISSSGATEFTHWQIVQR